MKADSQWLRMPQEFWHYVRALSENLGYSRRKTILKHTEEDIRRGLANLGLSADELTSNPETKFSTIHLANYFKFRADLIEGFIADHLQTAEEAKALFESVVETYTDGYTFTSNKQGLENSRLYKVIDGVPAEAPFNKQKGEKRDIDFLTATSNILISHYLQGRDFDQDPRRLPVFTEEGVMVGSMSRRMDGAFPTCTNPIALWEFKCYYYTTTFGSKISDAIYIADLDGFERQVVERETGTQLSLTLFVDAYSTWMDQGKSYLCRIIDLLHRGAISNLIIGSEVVTAIPSLVNEWLKIEKAAPRTDEPTAAPSDSA
ncbi:DUF7687 domain-containing protein [Trueperella bialowiezensis]|uniref:Uncharacterized protein n=1 Tax=Trueperella bialowiezensis TaxID=312285 RepID=A0A448PG44_9ACTO|nr:hypothetical protein [Trueperella bialowiezensis]VEI13886.1 Uncharacterised protein [Trueperella bialowiezensis]